MTIVKKNYRLLCRFLAGVLLIGVCMSCTEKEDELAVLKRYLVGVWETVPAATSSTKSLTIHFQPDRTVEDYFFLTGNFYYLVSPTELAFIPQDSMKGSVYKISFNPDGTITIYNFVNGTVTCEIKNITFKKKSVN